MPGIRKLIAAIPLLTAVAAIASATGLSLILASPETVMRSALSTAPPTASSTRIVGDEIVAEPSPHKVLASTPNEGTVQSGSIRALGWFGPVNVGDRITISRAEGQLRTLEVIEVRPLSSPLTRTDSADNPQKLLLVISRIIEEPDARTVRFIIEAPNTVPFEPAREFERPL